MPRLLLLGSPAVLQLQSAARALLSSGCRKPMSLASQPQKENWVAMVAAGTASSAAHHVLGHGDKARQSRVTPASRVAMAHTTGIACVQ